MTVDKPPAPCYLADSRVLVVDDAAPNRVLLISLLRALGVGAWQEAANGLQALEAVESFDPDLILLDLMMPQMDGFEVCRRLRADPRHVDLPILVQTSLNRPEDRVEAFEAGGTDYVSKPVNGPELLARVRVQLRRRQLIRNLQRYRETAREDLATARTMQQRLLPSRDEANRIAASAGLQLESRFVPSSELGGDLWGILQDGKGRPIVYLCDFSGHGVNAALNTFRLNALMRQYDFDDFDPATFLADLNRRLAGVLPVGQFATMLAGVVDIERDCFRYASAATPGPLCWPAQSGAPIFGDGSGLPLGIVAETRYESRFLPLPPGSHLFLYSDAAIEVAVPDSPSGTLGEAGVAQLAAESLADARDGLLLPIFLKRLWTLGGGAPEDDLTTIVLHRTG